tara:strand:+ start:1973 stop:2158 length:186 start_codon:yes stop_codon:yes gene_type:complete
MAAPAPPSWCAFTKADEHIEAQGVALRFGRIADACGRTGARRSAQPKPFAARLGEKAPQSQ